MASKDASGSGKALEQVDNERLAKLGHLFAGFAHEVRNPLSTIGLNLGLIKEDFVKAETPRDKRTYKRLSTLEGEVKRLQSVLDEFLRFVRRPELSRRMVGLNGFVQELIDFAAPEAQNEGVSLRFYPGREVGEVSIDPDTMRAVLVNLIRNARQACQEKDQIMVSSKRDAETGDVILRVTDTGPGMSEEALHKAFRPYFSTKKGGTGLGLPITRRIVEEHGGSIDATSEPGQGTQFTIRLPESKE